MDSLGKSVYSETKSNSFDDQQFFGNELDIQFDDRLIQKQTKQIDVNDEIISLGIKEFMKGKKFNETLSLIKTKYLNLPTKAMNVLVEMYGIIGTVILDCSQIDKYSELSKNKRFHSYVINCICPNKTPKTTTEKIYREGTIDSLLEEEQVVSVESVLYCDKTQLPIMNDINKYNKTDFINCAAILHKEGLLNNKEIKSCCKQATPIKSIQNVFMLIDSKIKLANDKYSNKIDASEFEIESNPINADVKAEISEVNIDQLKNEKLKSFNPKEIKKDIKVKQVIIPMKETKINDKPLSDIEVDNLKLETLNSFSPPQSEEKIIVKQVIIPMEDTVFNDVFMDLEVAPIQNEKLNEVKTNIVNFVNVKKQIKIIDDIKVNDNIEVEVKYEDSDMLENEFGIEITNDIDFDLNEKNKKDECEIADDFTFDF